MRRSGVCTGFLSDKMILGWLQIFLNSCSLNERERERRGEESNSCMSNHGMCSVSLGGRGKMGINLGCDFVPTTGLIGISSALKSQIYKDHAYAM